MPLLRNLPDPNLNLRDASDFIFGSPLSRKALETDWPRFALALRDLIEAIHRLVQSCHMPEFTDHGLSHLCSLVDRISTWTCRGGEAVIEHLETDDAARLLVAVLLHDLGMLSQKPQDLPDDATPSESRSQWSDAAAWVRRTHVRRLPRLAERILGQYDHSTFLHDSRHRFLDALEIASGHEKWPYQWNSERMRDPKNQALAALVAVADLLDEDGARCDTATLIDHREGTLLNKAHWLRHCLTYGRVVVQNGRISVDMKRFPGSGEFLQPVFGALRNHYRLVNLYRHSLVPIDAEIKNVNLEPSTGMPDKEESALSGWQAISGFETEQALCFHLLRTFMPEAMKDDRRLDVVTRERIRQACLEDVDLSFFHEVQGILEPRTEIEQTFFSLLSEGPVS